MLQRTGILGFEKNAEPESGLEIQAGVGLGASATAATIRILRHAEPIGFGLSEGWQT